MCWLIFVEIYDDSDVSVAGCLGYDVLGLPKNMDDMYTVL
jgi:hypothetical protein